MNRRTAAGDATVKLLCATFELSRAAYYAEARRQRGDELGGAHARDRAVLAPPAKPFGARSQRRGVRA